MLNRITRLLLVVAFAFATVSMINGCEKKSETEKTMDKIGDTAKDAAKKTEKAAKDAADKAGDMAEEAGDKVDDALSN